MKVAIIADWITGTGGAERVIYNLHKLYPEAPIYTSTYEVENGTLFDNADIRTAWFQKLPTFLRRHQLLTLPRQWYFSRLKLKGYDVVISAGSAEAKAVQVVDGTHINICYTPTLYYWVKPENYLQKGTGGLNPFWRLGLKILMPYVKKWDKRAAQNPDAMYGISTAVNERITKYYDRKLNGIVYPPVDIKRFSNDNTQKRSGFVTFGRQVKHKRFDLVIAACNDTKSPLVVVGDGPEHERLKKMAGPTITFKTNVSDTEIVNYIAGAEAFIFPNEEDFGIVGVEAQAAGTPVIAYRRGGSLDTIVEGKTGQFFDKQTPTSLASAIRAFDPKSYNQKDLIDNAQRFSTEQFAGRLKSIINENKLEFS